MEVSFSFFGIICPLLFTDLDVHVHTNETVFQFDNFEIDNA